MFKISATNVRGRNCPQPQMSTAAIVKLPQMSATAIVHAANVLESIFQWARRDPGQDLTFSKRVKDGGNDNGNQFLPWFPVSFRIFVEQ